MASPKKVWYCEKHEALGTEDRCFEELILAGPEAWTSGSCEMVPKFLVDPTFILRDAQGEIVFEAAFAELSDLQGWTDNA